MRIHYLQHVPFEGLGSIAGWAGAHAAALTSTKFFDDPGLPVPHTIDLLIVMGGPMSVNDEAQYLWLAAEKRFIRETIDAGAAVLGVCLGAQLIASALGARVYTNAEKEIGWLPVSRAEGVDASEDAFMFPAATGVFHWHGETFDLPEGAELLASSPACTNQAFQLGRKVIGLQFHLEVTPDSVAALVSNCRSELITAPYIQNEAEIIAAPGVRYTAANALMAAVLDFLAAG